MRKLDAWLRRRFVPIDGMPIGAPIELWGVAPKHPANGWVLDKAHELGRTYDDSNLAHYTSRSLLLDVLYAVLSAV